MRKKRKIIAYVLSMALMLTSLPIQLFAQVTNDLPIPMTALVDTQTTTPGAIQINPNKYIGDGYEVEFKVVNKCSGTFQGEFVLTNTSNEPLENWMLKFDFQHEITNMWNAQIVTHEANSYLIKNQGDNQDIAPGSSVNIGFQANWNDEIIVSGCYDLLVAKQEVGDTDYAVDFKVTRDWGQAFNGEISIINNTEETIEDWTLEFDFDRNIERFWTAEIIEHGGGHYVIKNAGYNANIAPGQTIILGFSGNPGNVNSKPTNYVLNQLGQEIDYEKDTDEDGLPDFFEKELGTEPNKADTDEDGLPDGYEYFYLGTDPLKTDTDGNGILDGDEDLDKDKLTNLEEYLLGTDPYNKDTDGDNLPDIIEKNIYATNPIEYDTDGDTIGDGDEIKLGLDPLNKYTFGILDSDYQIQQLLEPEEIGINTPESPFELSLEVTASGCIENNISILKSTYDEVINNSAIIGNSIDLDYEAGNVNSATLKFKIKDAYIENSSSQYALTDDELVGVKRFNVFKYFREDNLLLPIATYHDVNNNTIYADVDELGTYCVLDLEKWFENIGVLAQEESNKLDEINLDINQESKINTTIDKEESRFASAPIMNDVFTVNIGDIFTSGDSQQVGGPGKGGYVGITTNRPKITIDINIHDTYYTLTIHDHLQIPKSVTVKHNITSPYVNVISTVRDSEYIVKPQVFININNYTTYEVGTNVSGEYKSNIYLIHNNTVKGPYKIISSTGLEEIELKDKLVRNGDTNSDKDSLTDGEEVNWELMPDGKFPTLAKLRYEYGGKGYIVEGLSRMSQSYRDACMSKEILPILSDPTKEDGDGDGIWDDKDPNKLRKDTIETMYKISKDNVSTNPIYIDIDSNEVTIVAHILFVGEILERYPNSTKTYEQLAKEGIEKYWGSILINGTSYDFLPGLKGNVNVRLITSLYGRPLPWDSNQKYSICIIDNKQMGSSCTLPKVYSVNGEMLYDDWSISSPANFILKTKQFNYSEETYMRVAAHEFGHLLGIGDAYQSPAANITPEVPREDIMRIIDAGARATVNDIEMCLTAYVSKIYQSFHDDGRHPKSTAIKYE